MSMDVDQIQLTDEQKRQIAEAAERTGMAWAEVLREALLSYRPHRRKNGNGKQKSFYDALEEAGLIGIVKDAPPDLSTNPKHMEGFGRD